MRFSAIRQKPQTGYGFMASAVLTANEQKMLRKSGFSGAGTTFHNTYISKAVGLGCVRRRAVHAVVSRPAAAPCVLRQSDLWRMP